LFYGRGGFGWYFFWWINMVADMKTEKTQFEKDLDRYYQNRSKFTKIKPYLEQWKVYGQTVVNTLDEAMKVRGSV
jgi:hypothetical protein